MPRAAHLLAIASIAGLALAACGDDSTSSSSSPSSSSATTAAATTSAAPATTAPATTAAATSAAATSAAATSAATTIAAAGAGPYGGAVTPTSGAGGAVDVKVASTAKGPVLVDGKGMALYLYTKDAPGTSNCTGGCASNWPPLAPAGDAVKVGDGLDAAGFSVITRADGSKQVALKGVPLYHYVKDANAGDTTGEAVGQVWWLVDASGNAVR